MSPCPPKKIRPCIKHYSKTDSSAYKLGKLLNSGTYGNVFECKDLCRKQSLALKVIKINKYGQKEYKNMLQLQQVNPDHCNLVRLIEHFQIKNAHCLVYEKLDQSMSDFMRANKLRRLQLSEIRAIAQQMLVSLQTLESLKIVHSDIKPDNIMLVNQKSHPFKVKLIDFGLALKKSKMRTGLNLQNERYRAFEVIMGLPLDGGVDMWGLACCLAYFYIGKHLFDGDNIRDHLGKLLSFMGEPDDDLIQSKKHLEEFISLLKEMLQMDKEKRIKPSEALNHNFITMNHLSDSPYASRGSHSPVRGRDRESEDTTEEERRI
uniref:Protein kinase domain-containing protein n=1 Tax=Nothobranchius furzeri TaxID=105023 RepID=A0A8C6KQF3_NOTFU